MPEHELWRRRGMALKHIVWGIRWDREIDRRRRAMAVLALLAVLAIGLLARSAPAVAAQPTATAPGTTLDDVRAAIGAAQSGATGAGVDVAVVDTGLVPVPALAGPGKVVQGPDFSDEGRSACFAHLDTYGHGTHVAGIIAGNDERSGFQGIAPGARLVNLKAGSADGSTSLGAIVSAVAWAVAHRDDYGLHIRVLNLSFGTPPSRYEKDLLAFALEHAWKAGIVVVTSAGNDGAHDRGLTSPGYDPFRLTVGADDLAGTPDVGDDVVPDWSSRGDGVRNPDLVAAGRSIVSLRDARCSARCWSARSSACPASRSPRASSCARWPWRRPCA
jgi:subtilisin family serine protease